MSDFRANRRELTTRSDELRRESADLVRDSNHLRRYTRELLDQLRLFHLNQLPNAVKGTLGSR